MRSLMINVALIVLPLAVYFVVVTEHSSAYADQRSLRALQEIATQIDNRLDTLKNILSFAPGQLKAQVDPGSQKALRLGVLKALHDIPRVPVTSLSFLPAGAPTEASCRPPDNAGSDVRMVVDEGRNPGLRLIDYGATSWNYLIQGDRVEKACSVPAISTTFAQMIENTKALAEIPMIIVASPGGEVYAQLVRNHDQDADPPAHAEVREDPTVANLREILVAAESHAVTELQGKKEGPPGDATAAGGSDAHHVPADGEQLGLPVALDTQVAGTPYRAYILPYPLDVPVCKGNTRAVDTASTGPCTAQHTTIYLIGLKRSGLMASTAGSLSPVFLLGALLALLAACLLWPFLRHALLEPNDAVTWRQVRILCVCFLILAAWSALAARAAELGYFMVDKMDQASRLVSQEINRQVDQRVATELRVMDRLARMPINTPSADGCEFDGKEKLLMEAKDVPEPYPIAETFFQTDANGMVGKDCRTYNALDGTWPRVYDGFDLSKRAYFSLLKDGHGFSGFDHRDTPIVLQRLFNKPDGKKILQLSVARRADDGTFVGISAVNIGTIEVISPVLPLGIGYAIFERSTGTVVFHSDDSRSLVENLYAETEHNPTLTSAASTDTTRGSRFKGRYRGGNTTFYYHPMTYSPWGLVVFYDASAVATVLALSVVSALAHTLMTLLGGLALAQAAMWLTRRRHAWLWPQWRLRNVYPTVMLYLAVIAIGEFQILRHGEGDLWQFVVLMTGPLLVLTACFSTLSALTPEIEARRPRFLRHGLGLVGWSVVVHEVLLVTWACAAMAAGAYGACILLLAAVPVAWLMRLRRADKKENVNAWRRDVSVWPGSAMPAAGRASYRTRYLLFAVSLALVVSVVPALAIFDRSFEWYLSSGLALTRAETNAQWDARVQAMRDNIRAQQPGDASRPPVHVEEEALARARNLGVFGVASLGPHAFDVDGRLFGIAPSPCVRPPVAWPLGVWERKVRWDQRLLERLRQTALTAVTRDGGQAGDISPPAQCGLRGTIHELLHEGGTGWKAVLWDAAMVLGVLAVLMLLLNFSARRVTGISLPWSGRLGRQGPPVAPAQGSSGGEGVPSPPMHLLLLQPHEASLAYVRQRAGHAIHDMDAATGELDLPASSDGVVTTWVLRRIDIAVLDETRRVALLSLLETLVADPDARVVAIGDVSPVYRIARPHAYPGPVWPRIDDFERLRWIDLFTRFHKVYSVSDMQAIFEPTNDTRCVDEEPRDPRIRSLYELIHRETRALWPALLPIRRVLLERLCEGVEMTDRDVIEFVAQHAEVHYRKAWEYSTRDERLAMYHLAQGKLINMANQRVVEHLLRRGLVVFEPEPRIKAVSLAEFILNAELPGRMESYAAEAAEGLWQSVRVPFFVALMLVVAWLAYSSGDAFQAVVALVATSVAVIGQAMRLLGMTGLSAPAKDK